MHESALHERRRRELAEAKERAANLAKVAEESEAEKFAKVADQESEAALSLVLRRQCRLAPR